MSTQHCRRAEAHIKSEAGKNKMFMTAVDKWIVISHSTWTRFTSLCLKDGRADTLQCNETLLLKMTVCQTWRTEQTHLQLYFQFHFNAICHRERKSSAQRRNQVAFSESNSITILLQYGKILE